MFFGKRAAHKMLVIIDFSLPAMPKWDRIKMTFDERRF